MKVTVKLFASLRETIGFAGKELDLEGDITVTDVWHQVAGAQSPANVLMAVNMDYVSGDIQVKEGDEIAFFPPVTGG